MNTFAWNKHSTGFYRFVADRLSTLEVDIAGTLASIRNSKGQQKEYAASGVLVPIEFDPRHGEYVIILTKRSMYVPQPGDLCCPGGGIRRTRDAIAGYFIARQHILPLPFLPSARRLIRVDHRQRTVVALLWAAALRECWEETRLRPWYVEFLGALPIQQLQNFPRYIFPLVGRVVRPWKPKLSREVDRIVRVPIQAFLDPDNYAIYSQKIPPELTAKLGMDRWELPCLVIKDEDGEEILWGATFRILFQFVQTVTELRVADIHPQRRIERDLPLDYFTGRPA